MTLKTPSFWYRPLQIPPTRTEKILSPLSRLYDIAYRFHHNIKNPKKAQIPVLCVGNITAGGTGKTPTAIALLDTLRERKIAKNPYFLIRGYGGAEIGPLLVDLNEHTSWDVGDEALILAKYAPTIIGGNRAASAALAHEHGADAVILDDGLQNPGIQKDVKLVVINGEMGFGNQRVMPAGPLRQSLHEGLKMADGFILIGDDERGVEKLLPPNKPLIKANLKPSQDFKPNKDVRYLAFAGLGYPEKFFNFLKKLGLDICETISFSDHHPYDQKDINRLKEKAKALDAQLITTEKDFSRLPEMPDTEIETVPVEMVWEDEQVLVSLIQDILHSRYAV